MQQNEGNARVQTGETKKSPNERHLPLAPLATRVPPRRVHTTPPLSSFPTVHSVGCRSRARLDQGSTVDLALHSYWAPSFFFRHTALGDHYLCSFAIPFLYAEGRWIDCLKLA